MPTRVLFLADYIRKQTLTNAERYITPDLKEYEVKILNARKINQMLSTNSSWLCVSQWPPLVLICTRWLIIWLI